MLTFGILNGLFGPMSPINTLIKEIKINNIMGDRIIQINKKSCKNK